jgi:hypothetical protein
MRQQTNDEQGSRKAYKSNLALQNQTDQSLWPSSQSSHPLR